MDEKILNELKEIKKLMCFQLLASGVTPKGIAKMLGLSEKRVRNMFPVKEIRGDNHE
ncbi:MAG: helix-turn-helix domain-containing protein [Candidatus Woesearchaeota archaeon]|nr:helix-turn-helix domain-containing protein [Candidatus Woesearchaeota archaeon]